MSVVSFNNLGFMSLFSPVRTLGAALTVLFITFRSVLVDVGNLIHAEEHGIVGTPLPIRFTACEERIRPISPKSTASSHITAAGL